MRERGLDVMWEVLVGVAVHVEVHPQAADEEQILHQASAGSLPRRSLPRLDRREGLQRVIRRVFEEHLKATRASLVHSPGSSHHQAHQDVQPLGALQPRAVGATPAQQPDQRRQLEGLSILDTIHVRKALVVDDAHVDRTQGARVAPQLRHGPFEAAVAFVDLERRRRRRHAADVDIVAPGPRRSDAWMGSLDVLPPIDEEGELAAFADHGHVGPDAELEGLLGYQPLAQAGAQGADAEANFDAAVLCAEKQRRPQLATEASRKDQTAPPRRVLRAADPHQQAEVFEGVGAAAGRVKDAVRENHAVSYVQEPPGELGGDQLLAPARPVAGLDCVAFGVLGRQRQVELVMAEHLGLQTGTISLVLHLLHKVRYLEPQDLHHHCRGRLGGSAQPSVDRCEARHDNP
eukprot:scaffold213_cov245-Pinguiococcus_pyrenoidosus.AAC.36